MSILSVSRDPGQAIVFWGYGLLVFGMLVVLTTRIIQRRSGMMGIALFATALLAVAGFARAADEPSRELVDRIRRLPVQSDGRAMPLDTQARDDVRTVTAQGGWKGLEPAALVIHWATDPERWSDEAMVRIDGDVAARIGRASANRYASYRTLASSEPLRQAVQAAMARQEGGRKPSKADKHLLRVSERLNVLDGYLRGEGIRAIPAADRVAAWSAPRDVKTFEAWGALEAQVRPSAPSHYPKAAAIEREIRYNAVHPVRIAWILLLPAAIGAGLTLERNRWRLRWTTGLLVILGFAVMTWGIATRWQIAGHIPASNMYESMLFLGWGVGLFGVVSVLARNRMLIFNASAMAALVMLLLDRLPIDPFIHPIPPVLSGTPWLAIHVPIIMVSYSTFAIATFLAHLVLGATLFAPKKSQRIDRWSDLLYWYLVAGSILLIAGILTGSIWAASSWGRYWGWDPKEVWSLVAFLAYMAILHARIDGRLGSFGVAAWSIAAFWTILMTYLGVNFVLASGLHSYGFGSSGLVQTMIVIMLAEAAFLFASWRAHRGLPNPGR
jgi:cytochrome c-type biogenesis protein CcsB